jgi:hypothetical protein
MVDSREKGARAETVVRDKMRELTGLKWERTPGSGALGAQHSLKGDLYIPNSTNLYCVEVKHYKDSYLDSTVLTAKNPVLLDWWEQAIRQGIQVTKTPLLIFKHDRSKMFCAFEAMPNTDYNFFYINRVPHQFYVALLEDFIKFEQPKFIA